MSHLGKELGDEKVGELRSHRGLRNVAEDEGACNRNLPSSKPLLSFSADQDKLYLPFISIHTCIHTNTNAPQTYSDALGIELLRSPGGGLDDGRVVAAAKASVSGDLQKATHLITP